MHRPALWIKAHIICYLTSLRSIREPAHEACPAQAEYMIFHCNPGPLPEFALQLLPPSSQQAINFDESFSLIFYIQTIKTSNLRYKELLNCSISLLCQSHHPVLEFCNNPQWAHLWPHEVPSNPLSISPARVLFSKLRSIGVMLLLKPPQRLIDFSPEQYLPGSVRSEPCPQPQAHFASLLHLLWEPAAMSLLHS